MSNARGKDGSLKKVSNILIKSMMPLMHVVDKLCLADTTVRTHLNLQPLGFINP